MYVCTDVRTYEGRGREGEGEKHSNKRISAAIMLPALTAVSHAVLPAQTINSQGKRGTVGGGADRNLQKRWTRMRRTVINGVNLGRGATFSCPRRRG